jgi:hypothetical protein
MSETPPTLACDLGALSENERARRSTLASRVSARFREVQELPDGYAGCLDPDPAIVRDALDWLLLERRCCPFLRLELSFEPSSGPAWFRFSGGPGVKEFLAAAGLNAAPARRAHRAAGMDAVDVPDPEGDR